MADDLGDKLAAEIKTALTAQHSGSDIQGYQHIWSMDCPACNLKENILLALAHYDVAKAERLAACKHLHQNGVGSACSDGSSSLTGYCLDCGKDLSHKIEGTILADPMLQLQPRN